jgi:hypothetical protein
MGYFSWKRRVGLFWEKEKAPSCMFTTSELHMAPVEN